MLIELLKKKLLLKKKIVNSTFGPSTIGSQNLKMSCLATQTMYFLSKKKKNYVCILILAYELSKCRNFGSCSISFLV